MVSDHSYQLVFTACLHKLMHTSYEGQSEQRQPAGRQTAHNSTTEVFDARVSVDDSSHGGAVTIFMCIPKCCYVMPYKINPLPGVMSYPSLLSTFCVSVHLAAGSVNITPPPPGVMTHHNLLSIFIAEEGEASHYICLSGHLLWHCQALLL